MCDEWYLDEQRWEFMQRLVLWHNLPIVVCFAFYTMCDSLPQWFGRFKTQQETSNIAALGISPAARLTFGEASIEKHGRSFFHAVAHMAVNHALVIPLLWFTVGYNVSMMHNPNSMAQPWGQGGALWVVARLLGYIAFEDTLFYWAHRALHYPPLYRRIHKRHHEFNVPFSLAAEYAHPVETVLGNFIPFLAGPIVIGAGLNELCLWFVVRMVKTAEAHSGYAFPLAPFSVCPSWMVTAEQHDYHHSQNMGMYGSFFLFWDRVGRSDGPFKRHKLRQEAAHPAATDRSGPPRRFA